MRKYTFVLYHRRKEEFLAALQELGLVDITSNGWEPNERERDMLLAIEQHRTADACFKELTAKNLAAEGKGEVQAGDLRDEAGSNLRDRSNSKSSARNRNKATEPVKNVSLSGAEPFATGREAFVAWLTASSETETIKSNIEKARKEAVELAVWGDFSPEAIRELAEKGVYIRFFSVQSREFGPLVQKWGDEVAIEKIAERGGLTYFVVVQQGGGELPFDVQEYRAPEMSASDKQAEIAALERSLAEQQHIIARAAASADLMRQDAESIKEDLDFSRASRSGESAAEGALTVMEAWATQESSPKVDALLKQWPDVVWFKDKPTEKDEAPVVLKNRKGFRPFEFIGNFYSLPKYGTLDLTAYFAPFYMIFFGLCLGDAGYGIIMTIGAIVLMRSPKPVMRQVGQLTLMCGLAAIAMGFLVGGFFGVELPRLEVFKNLRSFFLTPDNLFALSLILGSVQIYFALILKAVNISLSQGFKYASGTIGWLMVVPYFALLLLGMLAPQTGVKVDFSSPVNLAVMGVGVVLMLFFHNPDKKPWVNLGGGLWNTYNDVVGFLGDFLSYIRLFALCMSGGTLALVFNQLAFGMTDGMSIVPRILVAVVILAIGHGINLFMSFLGAFVHPMRLTFVEFYKNAGFEASQREFKPFKKSN